TEGGEGGAKGIGPEGGKAGQDRGAIQGMHAGDNGGATRHVSDRVVLDGKKDGAAHRPPRAHPSLHACYAAGGSGSMRMMMAVMLSRPPRRLASLMSRSTHCCGPPSLFRIWARYSS